MKKLTFLFIVNALLAACGLSNSDVDGYSAHPGNRNQYNPSLDLPYKNTAQNSNKEITGMVSSSYDQLNRFIAYRLSGYTNYPISNYQEIASLAVWLTSDDRTASDIKDKFYENSTLLHNAMYVINKSLASCVKFVSSYSGEDVGNCFVKWRADNAVTFDKAAQSIRENADFINIQSAEFSTNDDIVLKFVIDDGEENNGPGKITAIKVADQQYNRIEDTYTFENEESILTYNSLGKELGLSYSDFGTYKVVNKINNEILTDNTPFAGGYSAKEITDIAQNIEFTGKAIGTVSKMAEDGEQKKLEKIDIAGNAALNFDNETGVSTLGATFDNWYDVTVKDDTAGTIEFSNYKNNANEYDMQVSGDMIEDKITASGANMDVNYYGQFPENKRPTEAAGLVQYKDANGVKLDMAFGAK